MKWRNIKTHPTTAERFLASNGYHVWVVTYHSGMGFVDEGVPTLIVPTHWMPLPTPPEVK